MNIQILSYDEIINILEHPKHLDYDYISAWFGDLGLATICSKSDMQIEDKINEIIEQINKLTKEV